MSIQTCTADDIHLLNRTKSYILTATFLYESVITDSKLNAHSAKLWQILFSKARFHPNLEIKVSYIALAKLLGKSTRTISRYIAILSKKGYLIVKENFRVDGSQSCNTFYVRVPENLIKDAKNIKNRTAHQKETSVDIQSNTLNSIDSASTSAKKSAGSLLSLVQKNLNEISCPNTSYLDDKNVIPLDDKNVIQKDINKINKITKQNKNVVISEFCTKQISNTDKTKLTEVPIKPDIKLSQLENSMSVIKQSIQALKKKCAQAESSWHEETDGSLKFTKGKFFGELDSAYENELEKLRSLEDAYKKQMQTNENDKKLHSEMLFSKDAEDARNISCSVLNYLENSLKTIGYKDNSLIRLLNEVCFEVRFGSLRVSCSTGSEISVLHAVHIALKLIREQRWQTPFLLSQSMQA